MTRLDFVSLFAAQPSEPKAIVRIVIAYCLLVIPLSQVSLSFQKNRIVFSLTHNPEKMKTEYIRICPLLRLLKPFVSIQIIVSIP